MRSIEAQPLPAPGEASGWPAGATTLATALVVGGIALLAYVWRVRVMKRAGLLRNAEERGVEPDVSRDEAMGIGADLRELTERLSAELDARADRLERLIALADERLAALEGKARLVEPKPMPRASGEFAEVYDLADAGAPAVEIARRTGRPTGQVELILNLRRGGMAM